MTKALVFSGVMGGAVVGAYWWLRDGFSKWILFPVLVIAGAGIYGALLLVFDRPYVAGLIAVARGRNKPVSI